MRESDTRLTPALGWSPPEAEEDSCAPARPSVSSQ